MTEELSSRWGRLQSVTVTWQTDISLLRSSWSRAYNLCLFSHIYHKWKIIAIQKEATNFKHHSLQLLKYLQWPVTMALVMPLGKAKKIHIAQKLCKSIIKIRILRYITLNRQMKKPAMMKIRKVYIFRRQTQVLMSSACWSYFWVEYWQRGTKTIWEAVG